MAVTTKKTFSATTNATTTTFSPVSIQLNNQDDLDVYVTLSGGTRVLQLRQSTGSTAQSSHPQVNNTDGLYFPAVSAGTTLYNYTLSSDNNTITFNSALPSGAVVFCERRTRDADSSYTSFASGSTIRATDLNNSSTESNFTAQDARNKALDLEGSIFNGVQPTINGVAQPFVNSSKIIDGSIATADIAADAITNAKIADDAVDSPEIKDNAVLTAKITNNAVTGAKIATGAVDTTQLANGAVTTVKLGDDAVTTAKIADDAVDSNRIASNAVTTAKIADNAIVTAKISDNAVTTTKISDSNITTAKINDDAINRHKIADGEIFTAALANDAVTSDKIANNNVTTAKINDNAVTAAKIVAGAVGDGELATSAVITSKLGPDAVTGAKIADDSIDSEHYVDGSLDTAHLANGAVTTAKLGDDAVTTAKIADAAVDSNRLATDAVTTAKVASSNITNVKLASNAVTESKITDANITTVKIADSNVTLAKLASDLKQTSISNSDTQLPTSGAVVDYVAAQIAPLGGLEVIATDAAFPNTQPSSGVVISISDAAGVVVNGSGVSTTGRTVGGSTVTINNFPSSLNNETLATGVGLMVSSTGSSQTYNYHKLLAAETDVKQLSDDINDFAARYRVGSSNPTTNNDAGDLFFNTGSQKLLVYNATNTAWEETQTVGNFFINTISSSSGTGGGSASFNNNAYRFTISNAGTYAQQHIVSINGVVQKPNTGTSQPSEGFAIDGGDIIFSSAPTSGADYFIITVGASVSIGTPSDGTVSTAKLASGAVTTVKIADSAVTTAKLNDNSVTAAKIVSGAVGDGELATSAVITSKLGPDAVTGAKIADDSINSEHYVDGSIDTAHLADANVTQAKLADQAVNEAKLQISNAPTNGYFLSAQSGNTGGLTWAQVTTDLVGDTSPQLGGDLASNGNDILLADNDFVKVGTGNDLTLSHNGTNSFIANNTGELQFQADDVRFYTSGASETHAKFINNGAVELYHDNSKKFSTINAGAYVTGSFGVGAATNPSHHYNQGIHVHAAGTGAVLHLTDNTSGSGAGDGFDVLSNAGIAYLWQREDANMVFGTNGSSRWNIYGSNGHLAPNADSTYDIGTNSVRVRNGYFDTLYGDGSNLTGISSDLVDDNSPQLGGNLASNGNAITMADNDKIKIGTGSDLEIYHDGGGSYIANSTGILRLQAKSGENSISLNPDAAVELYHNNSKQFETTSEGVAVYDEDGDSRITFFTNGSSNRGSVYASSDSSVGFLNSSGNWSFRMNNSKEAHFYNHAYPSSNNSYDLGNSSYRWRNIYTNDLHLSNEGSSNDVDGTWGNWTIQEGESDLFLKNNRSGKKYKFNLTEVS